jgi:DmsE family decaheme c-type cytochrome
MEPASDHRIPRCALFPIWVGIAALATLSLLAVAAQTESGRSGGFEGGRACLVCHGEDGPLPASDIVHGPHTSLFGRGRRACAACHGASEPHFGIGEDGRRPLPDRSFGAETPADEINATCSNCHAGQTGPHWAGSAHDLEGLACTDCHSVHGRDGDPMLDAVREAGTCLECHQDQRSEFLRPHRHPVGASAFGSDTGLMACSDCHDAHGSTSVASLNGMTLNQTCYECHAELRGPFLWEHAPVREDCSSCHVPHGAVHDALLRQRPPQLCQQCHLAQFHPSTVRSGTGLPPLGADPNLLGQSCMNCHTAVHGSNHPSSPGFTR